MYKTVLKVNGMACGMCEAHLNEMIRKNFKVKKVKSSHRKGERSFISEEVISRIDLENHIKELGYDLIDMSSEIYEVKHWFK